MDSDSLNKTCFYLNSLSGNCYPLKSKNDNHSIKEKCYNVFTWIITITVFIMTILATLFIPFEEIVQRTALCIAVFIEVIFVAIYFNLRLPLLEKMNLKMEEISIDDPALREAIARNLDPISKAIRIAIFSTAVGSIWDLLPILKVCHENQFTYTDFSMPAYFPFEPFDKKTFALAVLIQTIGGLYASSKKCSVDVLTIHKVALLTAHYDYLKNNITNILDSGEADAQDGDEMNLKDRLRKWIKHHQSVIEISRMLKDFTAVNVLIIYINNTVTFCLLAFLIIKFPSGLVGKCVLMVYGSGNLIQLFVLCYCAQKLLEASTSVSTEAFHVKWFTRSKSIKSSFNIITVADNFESRLSAFGMVDLSLATFSEIMQLAYSTCLFLLNV